MCHNGRNTPSRAARAPRPSRRERGKCSSERRGNSESTREKRGGGTSPQYRNRFDASYIFCREYSYKQQIAWQVLLSHVDGDGPRLACVIPLFPHSQAKKPAIRTEWPCLPPFNLTFNSFCGLNRIRWVRSPSTVSYLQNNYST